MTTFNTGNPIGSTDARDLSDNAENFDKAINSIESTWNDRLGVTRDTLEGALSKLSFYRVGTFAAGYTLTNMRQTLEYSGNEYSWAGSFPKVVAAGATPATSGGIRAGAWVDRTQETLRSDINIVVKRFASVADMVADTSLDVNYRVATDSYIDGLGRGGAEYIVKSSGVHDGGSVIALANGIFAHIQTVNLTLEHFGCCGDLSTSDDVAFQNAINYAASNHSNLIGDGKYLLSSGVTIPQYDTTPNVANQFAVFEIRINKIVYSGSGNAVTNNSPVAKFICNEMIGPSGSGASVGYKFSNNGDAHSEIKNIHGFGINTYGYRAYGHSLSLGYSWDSLFGNKLVSSNACNIDLGRTGGQYSTSITDTSSCDVGCYIDSASSANKITGDIEYCHRTTSSVGFEDHGFNNKFTGYIESCALYAINSDATSGTYDVINGGSVLNDQNAFNITGKSKLKLNERGTYNQTPNGSNTTLTYVRTQKLATSNLSDINSNGLNKQKLTTNSANNKLLNTNDLSTGWTFSGVGGALLADLTVTSVTSTVRALMGAYKWTQLVVPAHTADDYIYRWQLSAINVAAGPVSFGGLFEVTSGSVEVMLRVLDNTNSLQSTRWEHITSTDCIYQMFGNFIQSISSSSTVFELSIRSRPGGTIRVSNLFLSNANSISKMPPIGSYQSGMIMGAQEVNGDTFTNGLVINGGVKTSTRVVTGAITIDASTMYSTLIIVGSSTYNVTLFPGVNGQEIEIKRDSTTGFANTLIPSSTTVDGSSSTIDISAAGTFMKLKYISQDGVSGWFKI